MILAIIVVLFMIRLYFLKLSKQNEKNILANGGQEYGVATTKALTVAHILYYFSCVTEAIVTDTALDTTGYIGLVLIVFSMYMLYTVTRLLSGIWTVKLMLVKNHQFNDHWLFRTVKHPNYFLNIAPELIGIALLCHAKYSALILLPIYAYILSRRISEENKLLREVIIPNTKKAQPAE